MQFVAEDIVFEVETNADELAAEMFKMAVYLEDLVVPLTISKQWVIADMKRKFDSESGEFGSWEPHSPNYRTSGKILWRTGSMRGEALDEMNYEVRDNALFFNMENTPQTEQEYPIGVLHEEGTETATKRRLKARQSKYLSFLDAHKGQVFGQQQEREAGVNPLSGAEYDQLQEHSGAGKNLPARPWIGLTTWGTERVLQAFISWFDGGVTGSTGRFIKGVTFSPRGFASLNVEHEMYADF